jgi:hypothetical protein
MQLLCQPAQAIGIHKTTHRMDTERYSALRISHVEAHSSERRTGCAPVSAVNAPD